MTQMIIRLRQSARALLATLETLHRIQFSAPWTNPRPR